MNIKFRQVFCCMFSSEKFPGSCTYLPMKMEQTECSETLAYKVQKPGELPRRKRTTYRTRGKFEIKDRYAVDPASSRLETKKFSLRDQGAVDQLLAVL